MIVKVIPLDRKPLQGGPQPDALAEVIVGDGQKFIGIQEGRAAEADAPFLGEPYPLCLPRPDLFPLVLRHERQHLQHDVRDKPADERIRPHPRIQKRHVQHQNIRSDLFRDPVPLLDDTAVTAPQAVDGLYHEQIALFQPLQKALVFLPLEVFAALFFRKNAVLRDPELAECGKLPFQVLIFCRYPRIRVRHWSFVPPVSFQHNGNAAKIPPEKSP